MTPLFILIAATLLLRAVGFAGVKALATWRDAARFGLAVMFVFTGSTHFSSMKYDYAAMVPPPLTGQLWVIYLTGLFEIVGAIGLLVPTTKRVAGICLFLLLLALFPANVYAVINAVQFRGAPPTDLWLRALMQAIFVGAVWWSTVGSLRIPQQPMEQIA